ncbi:MAG: hypothetical protein ACD_21C00338G0001, partial [uncultured bacterium]
MLRKITKNIPENPPITPLKQEL